MSELKRTPLYDNHVAAGARMVEFAGWRLPVAYRSQIEEHRSVRSAAGMFDVSHMTIIDLHGARTDAYLGALLANDVGRLGPPVHGVCRALYTCMLDDGGGVLDDLIVYRLGQASFRLVVNAATREKDLAWLNARAAGYSVAVVERADLAMVAVQGPRAVAEARAVLRDGAAVASLAPFSARCDAAWFVARTGYTGEDGIEIMLPAEDTSALWEALRARGVVPCGLGARDTLRLEAGLNLYGLDMDESVTPLECGLGWTVALAADRPFVGRRALEARLRAGVALKRIGLILQGRGMLRAGCVVRTAAGAGTVTSGTFSPALACSIALARVPSAARGPCEVVVRGRTMRAHTVSPPFVRNGAIQVEPSAAAQ